MSISALINHTYFLQESFISGSEYFNSGSVSSPSRASTLRCLGPAPCTSSSCWCCPSLCLRSARWGIWRRPSPWTPWLPSAQTHSPPNSSLHPGKHKHSRWLKRTKADQGKMVVSWTLILFTYLPVIIYIYLSYWFYLFCLFSPFSQVFRLAFIFIIIAFKFYCHHFYFCLVFLSLFYYVYCYSPLNLLYYIFIFIVLLVLAWKMFSLFKNVFYGLKTFSLFLLSCQSSVKHFKLH